MRRALRILFNFASLVSFLLLIAGSAIWIRGYSTRDDAWLYPWSFHEHPRYKGITAGHGVHLVHHRGSTQVIHNPNHCVTGNDRKPFDRCRLDSEPITGVARPPAGTTLGFRYKSAKFGTEWIVPDYAITLPFAILPLSQIVVRLRRRRHAARGLCPTCGYDLRASPDRCPECGSARMVPPHAGLALPAS